ncbi:uncharacterized protein LOC111048754 [Nilaparvata lugens]|uniref:uncharacterized protein LOC111048754 n=1 Tax=Nilaparvata lugens TaxID=108931 RepID=UPI00193DDD8E|nr:uncharacterized protein LOC111048754 [Nilaparvata lugens]
MSTGRTRTKVRKELRCETTLRDRAEKYQRSISEIFGDRQFDTFPTTYLRGKVAFALFGPPPYNELTSENVEVVNKLVSHINFLNERNNFTSKTYLGYTFVHLRYKDSNVIDIQVLFKLRSPNYHISSGCLFVDLNCRTYNSWADYLKDNCLPKCDMCFPKDGEYSLRNFSIEFGESPACKSSRMSGPTSLLRDIIASGITLAALALTRTGGSLGSAETYITKNPFAVYPQTSIYGCMPTATCIIPSVGMVSVPSSSINKIRQGNLDVTDTQKFIHTFLFFFNESLSIEAAKRLISKIASLIDSKNGFYFSTRGIPFSPLKEVSENSVSEANLNRLLSIVKYSIKSMLSDVQLSHLDTAVYKMVDTTLRISKQSITLQEGYQDLSEAYKFLWSKFEQSVEEARPKVEFGPWTHDTIENLLKSNPDTARELLLLAHDVIEYCGVEDTSDLFMNRIYYVINQNTDNYYYELTAVELLKNAHFLCYKLKKIFDSEILGYQTSLDSEKQRYGSNFDYAKFIQERNISSDVDLNCFFLNEAINNLLNNVDYLEMYQIIKEPNSNRVELTLIKYREMYKIIDELNAHGVDTILETNSTKHFLFKGPRGQASLTDKQYWKIAHDLSGFDFYVDNASIQRLGNFVFIDPNDENQNNKLIFYNSKREDSVAGLFSVININQHS